MEADLNSLFWTTYMMKHIGERFTFVSLMVPPIGK